LTEEQGKGALGRRPVEDLPDRLVPPELGDPVPAIPGQQRHRVDYDEPLDQVRTPLRPDQRQPAPVVDDQLAPGDSQLVEALLERPP
jgi:hypothetical protein